MGAQAVRLSNIDIDNALENKDFEVLFQPIFDLGNGALARMETFVRWRHPDLGVLPPGAFISFFETQGRMSELTRYVLGEALTAYMQWRGPFSPGFSINLALSDLNDEAFAGHFVKLMRDREFPPDLVTLECPMPAVDADMDPAAASFARLRKTGARLAIEVRGRANDFLRSVDPFPFDEIKTGGSSILRFARTVRGPGLSAISDLLDVANKANAAITAVGVEDQASLAALRGLGFTAAQGNHLAKVGNLNGFMPSRVNEVRELLGLAPLSEDDLAALFRTAPPEPKAAATAPAEPAETGEEESAPAPLADELPQAEAQPAPSAVDPEGPSGPPESDEDAERRARARDKARTLALAKRAKAREARKAAAIRRAKAKAAQAREVQAAAQDMTDGPAGSTAAVPRDLQERLAQEFAASPAPRAKAPGKDAAPAPAAKPAEPADAAAVVANVKKRTPVAQDAPAAGAAAHETASPATAVRLGGSAARAYFHPGVRVGGPALNPAMDTSAIRRAAAAAVPKPAATVRAPAAQSVRSELAPQEAPHKEQRRQNTPEPDQGHVQGDLLKDDPTDEPLGQARPARSRRRRKNLLTRKYRFRLPDHFWPKSWKQRLRRFKTARRPASAE